MQVSAAAGHAAAAPPGNAVGRVVVYSAGGALPPPAGLPAQRTPTFPARPAGPGAVALIWFRSLRGWEGAAGGCRPCGAGRRREWCARQGPGLRAPR